MNDIELARYLADGAGRLLLDLRASGEFSGKELGNAGDAKANVWLMDQLAQHRPDDGVLSEETKDTPARLAKSRVWIIDPVDGTREYGEERTDWAVHIGMAVDGRAVLGAVGAARHGPDPRFRNAASPSRSRQPAADAGQPYASGRRSGGGG